MKTFKVKMYGKEVELYCKRHTYAMNGNTMVQLVTVEGEPYCALSTNPDFLMEVNTFYSCPNNYGPILAEMYNLGMITLGNHVWRSGFNTYQSFIINVDIFSQYEKESI